MLADPARGWAWTRAVLGLPAQHLHLCGEPAALPLLQALAQDCGEGLISTAYKRLSPLVVEEESTGGIRGVQPGDCVVAFSRKTLHRLRQVRGGDGGFSGEGGGE